MSGRRVPPGEEPMPQPWTSRWQRQHHSRAVSLLLLSVRLGMAHEERSLRRASAVS